MPHRAFSPAASEIEVDISKSLFDNNSTSASEDGASIQHPDRKALMQDPGAILDAESESDDAEFIAETQAASNRKASNLKGRSVKKGGGFQAMGLNANTLKAVTRKGFSVPTPIQRKTIPLILGGQDVVGMARTGSGKTAAFVIPMLEKLKSHSAQVGARALILSPSRELALQTLKVVKELGRGTDLKCVLLVGGDSLEEQFSLMAGNPDIVIATPGRFLHLKVEMVLDLSSIRYVVFDEADRLFEMGFAAQLTEILYALPPARQTLLFSATLPKSLVEFARAGLQEPHLVRLDSESKISPDLESAFFTMKTAEKEGALLHVLNDIIKIPAGQPEAAKRAQDAGKTSQKRKRGDVDGMKSNESPTEHSTLIFCATKHHVEYLAALLRQSGFAVSHAYGSLDQTARKMQVQDFRSGLTNILVVTDVAARGIDIPVLANVINYDFPAQPKIFIHRVGRTARAGKRGWSYSLVRESDAPYLLDLQLFLAKRLVLGREAGVAINYTEDVVVGSLARDRMEKECEWITKLLGEDDDLSALRSVAGKGEKLYLRTRNAASSESARRAKEATASERWTELHPLFADNTDNQELEREKMLARVSGFRPPETIFEVGKRGADGIAAEVIKKKRGVIEAKRKRKKDVQSGEIQLFPESKGEVLPPTEGVQVLDNESNLEAADDPDVDMSSDSQAELEVEISDGSKPLQTNQSAFQDPLFFMSYLPTSQNIAEDRAYSVHSSNNNTFLTAARSVTMDFGNDDGGIRNKAFAEPSRMRWDKKNKKYVSRANDEDGSKGGKNLVRGESGQKIAASFRSGRFDAWRKSNKISKFPRIGEVEKPSGGTGSSGGRKYRHKQERAPKDADKFRDDFHKRKKLVDAAKEKRIGRFKEGSGKREILGSEAVRKERGKKEKRKEKNARPAKRSRR